MKALLGSTLALMAVLACVPTVKGCAQGIIPNYHFKNAAENMALDQETRDRARETYELMERLSNRRNSAPQGEGITEQGGDDQDFDLEQDPGYKQELQDERDALDAADNDVPQPALYPNDAPPDDGGNFHGGRRRASGIRDSIRPDTVLSARQAGTTGLDRYVYTDMDTCASAPPYALVRKEGGVPATDGEANLIYDALADVYALFNGAFSRTTLIVGPKIHGTARYCYKLANAFWDGTQMLYGDGDGVLFVIGSLTRDLTVHGHEVTHGIVQNYNPLYYSDQSGALNEHLADVFGILTQQYRFNLSSAQSNWLIGAGCPVGGGALRSMKAPGTAYNTPALGADPQPAHMNKYYTGSQDNFGVHINSGIPNFAFYKFAIALGGNAWEVAGSVWFNVLFRGQGQFGYRTETFATFAARTINASSTLYGAATATKCRQAWIDVGVLSS